MRINEPGNLMSHPGSLETSDDSKNLGLDGKIRVVSLLVTLGATVPGVANRASNSNSQLIHITPGKEIEANQETGQGRGGRGCVWTQNKGWSS